MKIVHICMRGPVTDGWSYQDNLLPKYHKKLGYDVTVLTSSYCRNNKGKIIKTDVKEYFNEYNIKTIRLRNKFNSDINSKFKIYKDFYKIMSNENPDILFVHGVQFLDVIQIVKYLKKNPNITVYVDNHVDFSNSAKNLLSKLVLHKIIWRLIAHHIEPFTKKFYGVLPARVDFLHEIYKLPKNKLELLVMGADDDKVKEARKPSVRNKMRKQYGINSDDFLIVTGGKIDYAKKQTLLLMKAVQDIGYNNIKLIVFGSVIDELRDELEGLVDGENIQYAGWLNTEESYSLIASAELAIFPGRHSVFWEQVVGLGVPLVVKHWKGTTHVDLGGNCIFLYKDSIVEIQETIANIIDNEDKYCKMKEVSEKKGMAHFSYLEIAKKSLQ